MHLYTVLLQFSDYLVGIEQYEAQSPAEAMMYFARNAESLESYNREKIAAIILKRLKEENLLIHVASGMKGFWIVNFGIDFLDVDVPELPAILGAHIIQSDENGPVRLN